MMTGRKLITIVCPVYNEEAAIPLFYRRLQDALAPLRARYDFELIFTNNRSADRTLEVVKGLRRDDPSVHVLTFSRNFGYQASVLAGLKHAAGDAMVVIDVDCEDPPELIPTFLDEWEKGHDVVYGLRGNRPESRLIVEARRVFYRLNRFMADNEVILDMAEFSLISAHVRDAMVDNQSTFPFLRTEIGYSGFRRIGIPYDRQARIVGNSHYNLFRMTAFALGGILSSSTFLLRLGAYVAPPLLLANVLLAALDVFTGSGGSRGFRLAVLLDLMYLIAFVAVLCIYQARVYKDGVNRPVFIVDWRRSSIDERPLVAEADGRPARRLWTTHRRMFTRADECAEPEAGVRRPPSPSRND